MKLLKQIFLLFSIGIFFWACGSSNLNNTKKEEPVRIANDSLEYEITIIDPGFTNYLMTAKPESYYNQNSLETRNRVLVMEWNNRFRNPMQYSADIYGNEIDYQPNTDYGMEVNYKLYQYFQFAQKKYGMRLSSFRVD